jgi:rhamnosyltransferase
MASGTTLSTEAAADTSGSSTRGRRNVPDQTICEGAQLASSRSVAGVVTTYRPDTRFAERITRLLPQVNQVIIVDDGVLPENVALLNGCFGRVPNVRLIHNATNRGIAASLNLGIGLARTAGHAWALTLDDDTFIASDMVETLVTEWNRIRTEWRVPIAIMGMRSVDPGTGEVSEPDSRVLGHSYREKRLVITSGSLVSLAAYDAIGPFREEFFIDFVDYDYCFRARTLGFKVIQLSRIGMTHSVGRRSVHRLGRLRVATYNHSPMRLYYRFRNSTVFGKTVFFREPLFAAAIFSSNARLAATIAAFEDDRLTKLRWILRGFSDGVRGRLGRTVAPS